MPCSAAPCLALRNCSALRLAPPVRTSARLSRFRPTVEALEAREVPAVFYWTGAQNTDANNPYNWSVGGAPGLPGEGDVLHFSSTPSVPIPGQPSPPPTSAPDCVGLLSLGEGISFAAVYIESTYTGTVTIAEALTFGTFQLAGGAISQPDATFSLTVTGSFTWTGGTLNSSAALANFVLSGATAIIAPVGGESVSLGSSIDFSNGSITTLQAGTLNVTKDAIELRVSGTSTLKVDPGAAAYAVIGGLFSTHIHIKPNASATVLTGYFNAKSRATNEGSFTLNAGTTANFSGSIESTIAYLQKSGGKTFLTNNSHLTTAVSKSIGIEGGILATLSGGPNTDTIAQIATNRLIVTGGDIYINYGSEGYATFGLLFVSGEVLWNGGTFHSFVSQNGDSDKWFATKFTIGGTAAFSVTSLAGEWTPTPPTSGSVWTILISNNPIVRAAGTPSVDGQVWELVEAAGGLELRVKAK